jgi:hypothetical protein
MYRYDCYNVEKDDIPPPADRTALESPTFAI